MSSACIYMECPITGMILGVSRRDNYEAFGLPGGVVEVGETELQAAIRELREETGIELYESTLYYPEIFRREGGVTFRVHTSNIWRVHPRAVGETGRVAWITPTRLINGPFGDYNKRLLIAIGRL